MIGLSRCGGMGDCEAGALETLVEFLRSEVVGTTTLSAAVYCTVQPAWEKDILLTVSLTRTRIGELEVADHGCCQPTCAARKDFTFRDGSTALVVFENLKQLSCTFSDFNVRFSICPYSPSYYDGNRKAWLAENEFGRKAVAFVGACSCLTTLGITFSADGEWMSGDGECDGILESWVRHFLETEFPKLGSWRNPSFAKFTLTTLHHRSSGSRVGDAESFASRNFSALPDGNYRLAGAYCFCRDSALKVWTLTTSRSCEDNSYHHRWFSSYHHDCFPSADFVATFPAVKLRAGAWNAVNRNVVIRTTLSSSVRGHCRQSMFSLVTYHTWLATLEGGGHPFFKLAGKGDTRVGACASPCTCDGDSSGALACSPSWEEFGPYRCTVAELQELVEAFVPDAEGHCQANTSLTTLKLCFRETSRLQDYLTALKPLLKSNFTTFTPIIKRVELCYEENLSFQEPWRLTLLAGSSSQAPDCQADFSDSLSIVNLSKTTHSLLRDCTVLLDTLLELNATTLKHVKFSWPQLRLFSQATASLPESESERLFLVMIQSLVEQTVNNELRRNTWLQSLSLGWWEVVRVATSGDRWEMKYSGPCLQSYDIHEEYDVKVRMKAASMSY